MDLENLPILKKDCDARGEYMDFIAQINPVSRGSEFIASCEK